VGGRRRQAAATAAPAAADSASAADSAAAAAAGAGAGAVAAGALSALTRIAGAPRNASVFVLLYWQRQVHCVRAAQPPRRSDAPYERLL
jgi:hypothetical protein